MLFSFLFWVGVSCVVFFDFNVCFFVLLFSNGICVSLCYCIGEPRLQNRQFSFGFDSIAISCYLLFFVVS